MIDENYIDTVYEILENAQAEYNKAVVFEREAQVVLDHAIMSATNAGLEGKNKEARDAELAERCVAEYAYHHEMEEQLLVARGQLESAKMRENRLKMLMRLMEYQINYDNLMITRRFMEHKTITTAEMDAE